MFDYHEKTLSENPVDRMLLLGFYQRFRPSESV